MTPDHFNGLFEFLGALMLSRNILQLYRDKLVRGVHWMPTLFFAAWGVWNLYYYPSLDQWASFFGGLAIVSVNLAWFGMMVYYKERERRGWAYNRSFLGIRPEGWYSNKATPYTWRLPGEPIEAYVERDKRFRASFEKGATHEYGA